MTSVRMFELVRLLASEVKKGEEEAARASVLLESLHDIAVEEVTRRPKRGRRERWSHGGLDLVEEVLSVLEARGEEPNDKTLPLVFSELAVKYGCKWTTLRAVYYRARDEHAAMYKLTDKLIALSRAAGDGPHRTYAQLLIAGFCILHCRDPQRWATRFEQLAMAIRQL